MEHQNTSFQDTVIFSWSTSRGYETYGWNICRLDSSRTGNRYRTCGGGYDMKGNVLGQYIAETFQEELQALKHETVEYVHGRLEHPELYGLFYNKDGVAYCDGACGESSMVNILKRLGVKVDYIRQGRPGRMTHIGYTLTRD